jgi:disulfide oxidoreductase YuzD
MFIPKLIEKEIDYLLYVDLDEFLFINKYKNINELIQNYLPFDVLKINWLFFGSNNLIKNETTNNIIDLFTLSSDTLCEGTCALKSITKVNIISLDNESQYGPHVFPIKPGCIVKDIFNNELNSYTKNLSHITPFLGNKNYKNNIYIAHYSCQDLTTFIKRKFTNKNNYYWWINIVNVPKREDVYKYIDIINNNFDNFLNFFIEYKNNNNKCSSGFMDIPEIYIEKIFLLFNTFDKNDVKNSELIDFKYSIN